MDMKKVFESYIPEDAPETNIKVSSDRIYEITKSKIEKDDNKMKKPNKIKISLIAAAVLVALSATVFAAYRFLAPQEVAVRLSDSKLASAFEKENKWSIKPQISGDYQISLLGMTSGKNLSDYTDADTDKTYIVGAISKLNGEKITDYTDLMITPLVSGYEPWRVNIFTLTDGGKHSFIENGVEYFIIESSNIEIFADHTVYVAAYEGMAPGREIFDYSSDGTISFNKDYKGVKALFTLPLDKSKADPNAVDKLLNAPDEDVDTEISDVSGEDGEFVLEKAENADVNVKVTENENGDNVILIEDK